MANALNPLHQVKFVRKKLKKSAGALGFISDMLTPREEQEDEKAETTARPVVSSHTKLGLPSVSRPETSRNRKGPQAPFSSLFC